MFHRELNSIHIRMFYLELITLHSKHDTKIMFHSQGPNKLLFNRITKKSIYF